MAESPRLSFTGYSFGKALYRNKDAVKGVVAVLGTVNIANGFDGKMLVLSLGGAVLFLALKLIQDAVDFYFSDVKLD